MSALASKDLFRMEAPMEFHCQMRAVICLSISAHRPVMHDLSPSQTPRMQSGASGGRTEAPPRAMCQRNPDSNACRLDIKDPTGIMAIFSLLNLEPMANDVSSRQDLTSQKESRG